MHNLLRDLRIAWRALRGTPTFTAAAVLTLTLGIGASTAIFHIADAALLRALPFPASNELCFVNGAAGPERSVRSASFLEARDWAARNRSFVGLSLYDTAGVAASWGGESDQLQSEVVSASYFSMLGARPLLGRVFLPAEDRVLDRDAVALISHGLWQRRFGGDSKVLHRSLTLNGRSFAIVGVMPEGFRGVSFNADLWLPASMATVIRPASALQDRSSRWLSALGRLRPGVDFDGAQADLDRVARELAGAHPDTNTDRWAQVQPLREAVLGNSSTLLRALLAGAILLLLVACANVAALQLVRATGRERQTAIFRALGASPARVVRHQIGEGLLLAIAGGAGGLLAARPALTGLLRPLPEGVLPPFVGDGVDNRSLLFAAAAACCAVAFSALPALRGLRTDLAGKLRQGAAAAVGGLGDLRRPRAQQFLVLAEIALSLVLLIGAGLLGRSLLGLSRVDPGFDPTHRLAFSLDLPANRYSTKDRVAAAERLVESLAAVPGVEALAAGSDLPLRGEVSAGFLVLADGSTPEGVRFYRHRVLPGYFEALGVPLQRGRAFTRADRAGRPPVAIVSRAMAQRFWGESKAVGQRLSIEGPEGPWLEVVGVSADVRYRDLTTDLSGATSEPDVYLPFAQEPDDDLAVALRVRGRPDRVVPLARAAVAAVDPLLPIFQVETLQEVVERQASLQRLGALLLCGFGAVALALASIGLYGLVAFVVGLSRREIALRIALGGKTGTVVRLVVRQAMLLVAVGVAAGLATSAALSQALTRLLFGVASVDPLTFALMALLMLATALAASLLPAWRAARLEPQAVLRGE